MKLIRGMAAAIAAAGITMLMVVLAPTAAGNANAMALHSGHAAVAQSAAKNKYKVKAKIGKAKARSSSTTGPGASQASGCAPPLITFSRTIQCLVFPATVEVILEESDGGTEEETYTFGIEADVSLSASSTRMTVDAEIIPGSDTGDLPEPVPSVTLTADCTPCHTVAALVVFGSPAGGTGVGYYDATTHPNHTVAPKFAVDMYAEADGVKSNTVTGVVPGVRCDNMFPNSWKPGCVFPAFTPTVDMTGLPAIDKNISTVQGRGIHVGKPGGSHPLHRATDAQQKKNNRNQVCPKGKRPKGKQCDEYPFASSYEGGTTLSAENRGTAWVPSGENSSQGSRLSLFYRVNRVLDGDAYYVQA